MTRHFVLWGGTRLEPSRLLAIPTLFASQSSAAPANREREAAEIARLERELEKCGAGLGV